MKPFKINDEFRLEVDPYCNRTWKKLIYLVQKNSNPNEKDSYYWISGRRANDLKKWILKADKTLSEMVGPRCKK